MDSSERASHNSSADDMMEMKERAVIPSQVMTLKAYSVQKFIQLIQTVAQRSCKVFCIPFHEKAKSCPVQTPQPREQSTKELLQHSPSTVFIVNINNSTLTDCVIGDTFPCALSERCPLMQESQLHKLGQPRCSHCYDQQGTAETPPLAPHLPHGQRVNISIHGSHLNYVIIGDNNRMHMELSEVD